MNVVASQEQELWATLGLLRGVFSLKGSGQAFCKPQWIQLMMRVIKKASPLNPYSSQTKSLIQQVLEEDLALSLEIYLNVMELCCLVCSYANVAASLPNLVPRLSLISYKNLGTREATVFQAPKRGYYLEIHKPDH